MTLATAPPAPSPAIIAIRSSMYRIVRRQRRVAVSIALLQILFWTSLVIFPLALVVGLGTSRSFPMRIVPAALAWLSVIVFATLRLRPALRRQSLVQLARQIEKRSPDLQERISSALSLDLNRDDPFAPSPELQSLLSRQAQSDAARLDPRAIVSARNVARWATLLAIPALIWTTLALLPATRRPITIGLYRIAAPWQTRLPDSLADLTVQPQNVTLLEGDSLTLTATSTANRVLLIRQPDTGPRLTQPLESSTSRHWQISLPNLAESFRYRITTDRDDTPWFRATVIPRPSIQSLNIRYDYPKYTSLPSRSITGLDSPIDVLLDTQVTLTLRCSQLLDLTQSHLTISADAETDFFYFTAADPREPIYQTTFPIIGTAACTFDLISSTGIASTTQSPHHIIARLDQLPSCLLYTSDAADE